jgi:hypothetical protein
MSHTSDHARYRAGGAQQELTGVPAEANLIPKLGADGKVDTDILDATEVTAALNYATEALQGLVILAADGDTAALEVIQGNDSRIHTDLTVADDHPQYALLAGRGGGQTLVGGAAASESLLLRATSDATPGPVIFETDPGTEVGRFEVANGALVIGGTAPTGGELFRVVGDALVDVDLQVDGVLRGGTGVADSLVLRATDDVGGGAVILEATSGTEIARGLATGEFIIGATTLVGSELLRVAGDALLEGVLEHTGGSLGVFGTSPAAQASAYTQTFSTADKTHAARTAATMTDSAAGTVTTTVGPLTDPVDTPATADALRDDLVATLIPELRDAISSLADQINKLQVDQVDTAEVVNALVDDFQLYGHVL